MKNTHNFRKICTLLVIFAFIFFGCSNNIYKRVKSNLPAYDNGTVIVEPEAAIFIFKPEPRSEWHWYKDSTPLNQEEYGFEVQFELDDIRYQCGYSLFKHPMARPAEGSLKEMIDAGQIDLWKMEAASGGPIGGNRVAIMVSGKRVEYVRMRTIVDKNALAIVLKEKDIVAQFNRSRPDSILFIQNLPSNLPIRKSVKVTYRDEVTSGE